MEKFAKLSAAQSKELAGAMNSAYTKNDKKKNTNTGNKKTSAKKK
jgi:hypothetical protein